MNYVFLYTFKFLPVLSEDFRFRLHFLSDDRRFTKFLKLKTLPSILIQIYLFN